MRVCYRLALVGALTLFSGACAFADSSDCTLQDPSNLIQNCGFELGTYIDSNGVEVPNDWISNDAFDSQPGLNNLRMIPNNGQYSLAIGNIDSEALAALSQTLNDIVGASYSGSVFVDYGGAGDPDAFFDLRVGNEFVLSLGPDTPNGFLQYAFNFTGTGSDVFTVEGTTLISEWFVDDVVVTGAAPIAPEPKLGYLCAASLLGLVFLKRRAMKR